MNIMTNESEFKKLAQTTLYIARTYAKLLYKPKDSSARYFFASTYLQFMLRHRQIKTVSGAKYFGDLPSTMEIMSYDRTSNFFSGVSKEKLMLQTFVQANALRALVAILKPKSIFEIGTNAGGTTYNFLLNAPENCTIHTLDIKDWVTDAKVLSAIESGQIIRHFGNSLAFDFSPFFGKVDLVFVDGAHTYDMVKNDTENALKMISKNGCIVWDDYSSVAPGVTKYLHELSQELPLTHIENTSLVIYKK